MSIDKHGQGHHSSEIDVLLGIYEALSELRERVTENSTKQEMGAENIKKIEVKLEDIDEKINHLYVTEAQTSIKFGIITFFATLLSVSGINYALSQDELTIQGLPASQKMDVLVPRDKNDGSD